LSKNPAQTYFTNERKQRIVAAIQAAELQTSGEVKIMIEDKLPTEQTVWERAKALFVDLKLYETQDRNGVFIFLSFSERKFALLGDVGIDKAVPDGFWDETRNRMRNEFVKGNFIGGLELGIAEIGESLKSFFPYQIDDINELSDDVIVR